MLTDCISSLYLKGCEGHLEQTGFLFLALMDGKRKRYSSVFRKWVMARGGPKYVCLVMMVLD
jgi:hypothetical protein